MKRKNWKEMGEKMKLKKWGKNLISLVLTFFIFSAILDYIRKPEVPTQTLSTALYDLENNPFFLAQLSQEKPTILYFWGTWCGYCRYTSPIINNLTKEGFSVVSIALRSGNKDDVRSYLAEHQYQFTTVNDPDGKLSQQWNVSVTPTILILDKEKMILPTTGLTSYWGLKVRLWLARLI